jgi:hypothetical protein
MKLYSSFVLSEFCLPEDTKAKVNSGRTQSIYVAISLDFEIGFITTSSSLLYQNIGELLEDFIVTFFIGFTKVPASNRLPKTQVIIFRLVGLKAHHQITYTIS